MEWIMDEREEKGLEYDINGNDYCGIGTHAPKLSISSHHNFSPQLLTPASDDYNLIIRDLLESRLCFIISSSD